jgi:hypothetical protein
MGDLPSAEVCEYQLRDRPLCASCAEWGIVTRAKVCVVADGHYKHSAVVSLCEKCAMATARSIAKYGYRPDIGLDGYPLDPRHPANARGR